MWISKIQKNFCRFVNFYFKNSFGLRNIMQYDKECFSIGTFFPTKDGSLEDMLSFFETTLGCSPQFLKAAKSVNVRKEEIPVLYKQALRATTHSLGNQDDLFSLSNETVW